MTTTPADPSEHRRALDVNLRAGPAGREYDGVADRLARAGHRRVLDWGAGWGQVTKRLADRGVDVSSYDYRDGQDGFATQSFEKFPELEVHTGGDPVALPFEDGAFDAVLSLGVLEHVADPGGSLDEIARVLEPGGLLYVYKLPNRTSWLEWVAKRVGLYYHGKLPNDRVYSLAEAEALLRRHGYEVLERRRANMLPLTLTAPLLARVAGPYWRLNRLLSRVPLLNVLATDLELLARRP